MDAETVDDENIENNIKRDNINNHITNKTEKMTMEEMHINKFMEEMSNNKKKKKTDNNIMGEMYKEKVSWNPD
eukprot:13272722-Heterocapsa_arctica.AAC.1